MVKEIRPHIVSDAKQDMRLAPKHLVKQEFGRRLYSLMLDKGWTQSEMARRADLPRDAVSTYVRGKSLPTPQNLKKLAETLGVEQDDLLPNYVEGAIDQDHPAFEMKISPSATTVAWIRVNRLVSVSTALKIAALLEADNANDRGGSRGEAALQSSEG